METAVAFISHSKSGENAEHVTHLSLLSLFGNGTVPILKNSRHEKYAQELAKGKSQTEAYTLAGYKGDKTAASRLATNVNIQARVSELQGKVAAKVVAKLEISREMVTENLLRIAKGAEAMEGPAGHAVARQAWLDAAKLNGLVVERKEIGQPGDFARMSDEELDGALAEQARALGLPEEAVGRLLELRAATETVQ